MMVHNADYQDARAFLSVIGASGEEQMDFVTIQQVNLDRLEDFTYVPDATVLNTVHTIGLKIWPMSGYARSLYRYFTGERLELELEYTEDDPQVAPRAAHNRFNPDYVVWPNPTSGTIHFTAPHSGDVVIHVYDLQGRRVRSLIASASANEAMTIDISNVPEGMYLLLAHHIDNHQLLFSTKIIVTK